MSETPAEASARLQAFLDRVPYMKFLGMRAELAGDEMTAILPFSQHLIGNVMLPALHGGVIGAFMEAAALAQLSVTQKSVKVHKTIDVTIDYLRPGRAMTSYARAHVLKIGRQIANVQVECWQEARAKPVAALRGHFLLATD
jgi:uncharacterized protein (TIGR00369 family)